ncbi:GIY-YIG nuclease family protein [Paracoccus sp. YIM 132242]|uniref:GIY-YIG nuclease family protein n=1 Tax=Paracoccus lichenicola TaxID=2665644 RepID=A0A6L6HV69_9RHOB|nr:GIY-YIG nuclease family protein [Paracoccus lichenicola]MTE02093.1 GIY-YIG nuclease family protein [Paracoccus lichenicola]
MTDPIPNFLDAAFSGDDRSPASVNLPILDQWQGYAEDKGFEIVARGPDRYHLHLRCERCGGTMICKIFTLRTAQPTCPHCLEARWRALCEAAGVTYLGRGDRPNYMRVLLPCGHETNRQQELLERVRRGATAIRCAVCLEDRLQAEARARGWSLIGDDPEGSQHYRLYRHDCGHRQRVALGNMVTGRFTCGGCSEGWTRDKSHLYMMRFVLRTGREAVKVGFSRDPVSRLRHQLITERDQDARLIRTVEVPTGHEAMAIEKALHTTLRQRHPEAVLDRAEFAGEVKVLSELYAARIEAEITALLDRIEVRLRRRARRREKRRLKRLRRRLAQSQAPACPAAEGSTLASRLPPAATDKLSPSDPG